MLTLPNILRCKTSTIKFDFPSMLAARFSHYQVVALHEQVLIVAAEPYLSRILCCIEHVSVDAEDLFFDHAMILDLVQQA